MPMRWFGSIDLMKPQVSSIHDCITEDGQPVQRACERGERGGGRGCHPAEQKGQGKRCRGSSSRSAPGSIARAASVRLSRARASLARFQAMMVGSSLYTRPLMVFFRFRRNEMWSWKIFFTCESEEK